MAIALTNKASGVPLGSTNGITSATVAFANDKLYILSIAANCGSGDTVTSISTPSGGGITWTSVRATAGGNRFFSQVWCGCVASGASTGTVTATVTTVGGNVVRTTCVIDELTGTAATAASNGASAIVQSAADQPTSSTSSTVTLSAFQDAVNNMTYGFFNVGANQAVVAESGGGYSEAAGSNAGGLGYRVEYKIGQDTSVNATTSVAGAWRSIAMEIKVLAAGDSVGMIPI